MWSWKKCTRSERWSYTQNRNSGFASPYGGGLCEGSLAPNPDTRLHALLSHGKFLFVIYLYSDVFFKCNLCFPKNWNWNSETEIRMTTTRSIWAAVQIHAFCLCSSYNCSLAAPLEDGKCSHSPYSLYPRSNKSLKAATFPPLPSACGSGLSVDCQGLFHFCFSFPGSWLTPECPFRLSI